MATPTDLLCFCAAGAGALLALVLHATLRAELGRGSGFRERRAARIRRLWWGLVAAAMTTVATAFSLRPGLADAFQSAPWGCAFPVIALAGLMGVALCDEPGAEILAYLSSCALLSGGLATFAFASGAGLVWWVAGLSTAAAYMVFSVGKSHGQRPALPSQAIDSSL